VLQPPSKWAALVEALDDIRRERQEMRRYAEALPPAGDAGGALADHHHQQQQQQQQQQQSGSEQWDEPDDEEDEQAERIGTGNGAVEVVDLVSSDGEGEAAPGGNRSGRGKPLQGMQPQLPWYSRYPRSALLAATDAPILVVVREPAAAEQLRAVLARGGASVMRDQFQKYLAAKLEGAAAAGGGTAERRARRGGGGGGGGGGSGGRAAGDGGRGAAAGSRGGQGRGQGRGFRGDGRARGRGRGWSMDEDRDRWDVPVAFQLCDLFPPHCAALLIL
jgi:hypothetical protein